MDFAITWLGILGPLVFAVGLAIWGFTDGNRIIALWIGFSGALLVLVAMTLHLQQGVRKDEASAVKQEPTASEKEELRAYASIIEADVAHTPGTAPVITLLLRNTGKTIAHDVTWRAQFALASLDAKIPIDKNIPISKQDLPPGGSLHYKYVFDTWNPNWEAPLKSEAVAIIAFGEINYTDIYGNNWPRNYRLISGGAYGRKGGITPGKFGVPPESDKNKK